MSIPALQGRALSRWRRTAQRLVRIGGASDGNELFLYTDGDDLFTAMLAAIDSATHRVWVETYIFEYDALGARFLSTLTNAARRGVDVRLLIDDIGSSALLPEHTAALVGAGGRVVRFNETRRLWKRRLPVAMRDHRKITIVDDALGFVGGANITADYAGAQLGNGRFRDTHLLISGPATADLALVFARSWQHETHQELHAPEPVTPRAEGAHVQILSSSGIRKRYEIQRALYTAVARAQHRVLITTPYFVPPMRLLRTLRRVAERGVEVFVLTAGVSDVPIATVAARHVYGSLLEAGVRVYEMQGRTLHAKTAVVDGFYAHVGSFNLDRWSYDRNLEVVAMTLDPGVGAALEKVFRDDVKNSEAVSLDAWRARGVIDRLWGAIAWQLCRL